MEIVLNMFVALFVGTSYVAGYLLAALSLILLVSWIIDGRYKTNLSNKIIELLKMYLPEEDKGEKVVCKRCEEAKTVEVEEIEDNYCYLCGKKFKKHTASARDILVEKVTNRLVLLALVAVLLYTISTALFVVFALISVGAFCFYSLSGPKAQERLS